MLEKIKDGIFKIKSYWNTPPKGYDVSYREFVNLSLGFGGLSFISVLISWTMLSTSVFMMISYFKVSTGLVWLLSMVGAILGLIRAPILSMIIDNSNSKKGKFKPFLIWTAAFTVISFALIPYIPNQWNGNIVMSLNIPAIPLMGVTEASVINISFAVIVLFILLQVGSFFNTLLTQAFMGIEQTISTVAQERANIGAFKGLISNIPASVINVIMPVVAGIFFAESGHMLNINMYRIFFPICAAGGLALVLFTYYGTEEKVVVNKKYVAKVKFFEGARELSRNKYFWILTSLSIFVSIRGYSNITNWITQFSFFTAKEKTFAGLYCTTLLMNALVIGMVLGPAFVKKYGKKNVLSVSNTGYAVMVLIQLLVYRNPYLILFVTLIQNIFNGFFFFSTVMVSDVLDYQQWKTGKRLEGFWQNYSGFILTIATIFTSILLPIFLSFGGIGFGDDYNVVLLNKTLRDNAYKYQTLLALIGSVLAMIPIFFYDLSEDKHAKYVKVLKLRAAVDNYSDNELSNHDVLNVKEILDYAETSEDAFLNEEISKYDCLDKIIVNYEQVFAETEAAKERERQAELERNIELEEKKLDYKLEKAQKRAQKKNLPFDKDKFIQDFTEHSRYLNQKYML